MAPPKRIGSTVGVGALLALPALLGASPTEACTWQLPCGAPYFREQAAPGGLWWTWLDEQEAIPPLGDLDLEVVSRVGSSLVLRVPASAPPGSRVVLSIDDEDPIHQCDFGPRGVLEVELDEVEAIPVEPIAPAITWSEVREARRIVYHDVVTGPDPLGIGSLVPRGPGGRPPRLCPPYLGWTATTEVHVEPVIELRVAVQGTAVLDFFRGQEASRESLLVAGLWPYSFEEAEALVSEDQPAPVWGGTRQGIEARSRRIDDGVASLRIDQPFFTSNPLDALTVQVRDSATGLVSEPLTFDLSAYGAVEPGGPACGCSAAAAARGRAEAGLVLVGLIAWAVRGSSRARRARTWKTCRERDSNPHGG